MRIYLADYDGYNEQEYENLERLTNHLLRYKEMNRRYVENVESWTGRWMPDRPGDPTPPPKIWPKTKETYNNEYESVTEFSHGTHHGPLQPQCDDGKVGIASVAVDSILHSSTYVNIAIIFQTNLDVDWDHSPSEYTCYGHEITPNETRPLIYCKPIPKAYKVISRKIYCRVKINASV